MDLSCTPRARFSRKKFISPAASSPYRSPLMHGLPEKKIQSSLENDFDALKTTPIPLEDKNDIQNARCTQVPKRFVSPIAASTCFRSPLTHRTPISARKIQSPSQNISLDEIKTSTLELWEKNKLLKEKIQHLEQKGFKVEDHKLHIDKLHKYNEIKDAAQTIMGRLAIMEQKTIKEVHEDFGMTEND